MQRAWQCHLQAAPCTCNIIRQGSSYGLNYAAIGFLFFDWTAEFRVWEGGPAPLLLGSLHWLTVKCLSFD